MEEYSVIGKRLPRVDGKIKATGEGKYAADISLPNMLYGKILRSPYPHARILNINTSRAEKLIGVKAVITGKDTPGVKYGLFLDFPPMIDQYPLALDKVRYVGDEVAAVAAIDEDIAQEALELIRVEYEEIPAVFDPEESMKAGAPIIHDHVENNTIKIPMLFGDIEKGFRDSEYIREDRFVTQAVGHCQMEPHASVASFGNSGRLTLWTAKQGGYIPHKALAAALDMPEKDIKLLRPLVGGGFGGKVDLFGHDICSALLSRRTGRPVKIVYTREEALITTRQRHPMIIEIKTGVKKDGTLVAKDCRLTADTGAYCSTGPIAVYLAGTFFIAPYRTPNARFEGNCVYTNNPVSGAMRGHGAPQPRFADECQLDMIAKDLGIDPVEIRLKNATQAGDITTNKLKITSCGLSESIRKTAEITRWKEKRGKLPAYRGIGIGCSAFVSGVSISPQLANVATLQILPDGEITLFSAASDIGQGCDTVLCQIAAEELGVLLEDVRLSPENMELTPFDIVSASSRGTFFAGRAVKAAAADAKRQLFEVAAERLEANIEDLEARERKIYVRGSPARGISFSDAIQCGVEAGKMPIIGKGRYVADTAALGMDSLAGNLSPAYSFGATVAEVEVDGETGQVKVINMAVAHDCGFAINPMAVEGQVEGSSMMGLGQVLYEEFIREKGYTFNPDLMGYSILTALDSPEIRAIIVETIDPNGPFGAKECGEGTLISLLPAIVNAIYDALGVRIKSLPITPEKVLQALNK